MKRLSDLEPAEVSLVDKGANKRRFLILKSRNGNKMTKEQIAKVLQGDPKALAAVEKVLKDYCGAEKAEGGDAMAQGPMDERAQTALKAIVRILTPFKESLTPILINGALSAAGFQMAGGTDGGKSMDMNKGATMSPEPVKEDHEMEAFKKAFGAYKDHMEKLGKPMVPPAEVQQKASTDPDEPFEDEKTQGTEKSMVGKSEVFKALLAKVPAESKGAVEEIYKSLQESRKESEETKNKLAAVIKSARRKEFIEKAQSMKHVGTSEELADNLLSLHELSPELCEKVEKQLRAANAQIEKGNLFKEYGTSLAGNVGSSWEAIEKAAQSQVEKSGKKVTTEEAVSTFLSTSEGKRMYDQYQKERGMN